LFNLQLKSYKMITPSFSITATERILPRLALDFTTASLDSRITFTRSGDTATVTNSNGVITAINANLPRFDYNPTTLVCKGLLIEDTRTNLLLNSLIDGTSLSTQLVTTAAVANTLSFYGTGEIVLTGTSSATVVGTGAYPARTTLTFTPTVGVLTLTVTGTVQYAQLEAGAFASSFIPTAASQVTRNVDAAIMTGTNFSGWYNSTEGAFLAQCIYNSVISNTIAICTNDGGTANESYLRQSGSSNQYFYVIGASAQIATNIGGATANTTQKLCGTYAANSYAGSSNGGAVATDNSGNVFSYTQMNIGSRGNGTQVFTGHIAKIFYWPQRITNAEVQAFSK